MRYAGERVIKSGSTIHWQKMVRMPILGWVCVVFLLAIFRLSFMIKEEAGESGRALVLSAGESLSINPINSN